MPTSIVQRLLAVYRSKKKPVAEVLEAPAISIVQMPVHFESLDVPTSFLVHLLVFLVLLWWEDFLSILHILQFIKQVFQL